MGSKLKMKAPKKNRVLECDNQMSQAFARAMQNSRKELEIMQIQAYNDGFNTGDDWANTINTVTCVICGKQYVRHLANVENADEIAEKLCQFVYDLKMGFKNQEDTKC